jgi:hypothetical protein
MGHNDVGIEKCRHHVSMSHELNLPLSAGSHSARSIH